MNPNNSRYRKIKSYSKKIQFKQLAQFSKENILYRSKNNILHTHHYQSNPDHTFTTFSELEDEPKKEFIDLVQVSCNMPSIRTLIYHKYKVMINNNTITAARSKFMAETLRELVIDPSSSLCDRLLPFFE